MGDPSGRYCGCLEQDAGCGQGFWFWPTFVNPDVSTAWLMILTKPEPDTPEVLSQEAKEVRNQNSILSSKPFRVQHHKPETLNPKPLNP